MFTRVKTPAEQNAMRESGRMLATVLQVLKSQVAVGMTTRDLSDIAKRELKGLGGQPAFLGYQGFPDVICISLNNEVVHGIPGDAIIADGDIVSMDFGVRYKGMITDAALSVIAGSRQDPKIVQLLRATEESLLAGIAVVHNGVHTGTIGNAVETVLKKGKYGNVRDLVGHGVGHEIHEDPNIPNYGRVGTGYRLDAGMTIAIEPMATLGTHHVYVADDGWTVLTTDGSLSAHFEHTVLITQDGCEIVTQV